MVDGRMVNGQWSMINGRMSMVNGRMVNGQWSMSMVEWSIVNVNINSEWATGQLGSPYGAKQKGHLSTCLQSGSTYGAKIKYVF